MTVTYTAEVATTSFFCFMKLLWRWRGSIYKLLWKEIVSFISIFCFLNCIYRFALPQKGQRIFETVSRYCEAHNDLIPIGFVLGFYVMLVLGRWWEQFCNIPWPDRLALFVSANVHGLDDRGRLMRRTIMRYMCLSLVMTLSSISIAVKKRFPTWAHMTEAGFMNRNEEKVLSEMKTVHNTYFIPLVWCTGIITRARKEGRIKDDFAVKTLIDEVNAIRGMLGTLFCYDWISIPLVYTQVATIAVYTFVLSCIMGRQFVHGPNTIDTDVYFPVFTFLQISFYVGWLKVAEVLINPFGEDDDDFDMNWVLDRNLQVAYLIVDEMHQECPELIKDQYWDETNFEMPYTVAAEQSRDVMPHMGSAYDFNIRPDAQEFVPLLSTIQESERSLGSDVENAEPTDVPTKRRSSMTSITSRKSGRQRKLLRRSTSRDSRMSRPRVKRPSQHSYRSYESDTTQATVTLESLTTCNTSKMDGSATGLASSPHDEQKLEGAGTPPEDPVEQEVKRGASRYSSISDMEWRGSVTVADGKGTQPSSATHGKKPDPKV